MSFRGNRERARLLVVLLLSLLLSVNAAPVRARPLPEGGDTASSRLAASYNIQHVFLIIMENKGYSQVWDKPATPYLTALGKRYARAENYHALTHPSLPNYLKMYAGGSYGITTDCSPSSTCHVNAVNLADNLGSRHISWRGYMESMPAPCTLSSSGRYVARHNPFIYFDDIRNNPTRCRQHVVPLTALALNLASTTTTPHFAMIIPDECNDTHNCSISRGDRWLKANVPPILASPACKVERCLLIVTWDEDGGHDDNRVLTIFAGSAARPGAVSPAYYNHFSLLRTIENILGVSTQTKNDAAALPMNDLLK